MRYRLFHIQSVSDLRCLEATAEDVVELQGCDETDGHTNQHQRWQLLETDQLRNERHGRCLELDDQKGVSLQPCANQSAAQHWWIRVSAAGRLEFDPTRIDEVNTGDQRHTFNPHLNFGATEFECNDC
eukprot:TRINITY_DN5350_c0_g1_i3.p3 TRINITY_DN5350_c0_g1~~TRINITY_DN5350_c0_g1_i3.p3  ORF type:complete len:128 (+),score=29.57 TRINITY_DN5350_c0_g1_i3:566-949(+)